MLDRDLAEFYGVATKRLNEQVRRNAKRSPKVDIGFAGHRPEHGGQ
ncbi:MAG: ORF6N domain-containing protein [Desulfobacterales bacterium]